MPFRRSYLIPIVQGIWYPLGFFITYYLSIKNKDVPPIFPYVSDTGAYSTEGCIFTLILNIGALLMFLTAWLRYVQVKEILEQENKFKKYLQMLNKVSFVHATAAAIGLVIVGSFQISRCIWVHLTGAGVAFGNGWVFEILQTYLSFIIYPIIGCKWMNYFRLCINIVLSVGTAVLVLFGAISLVLFKGTIYEIVQWTPDKGGHEYHLVSVAAEWVVVLSTVLYMTTFALELKSLVLFKPKVVLKSVIVENS